MSRSTEKWRLALSTAAVVLVALSGPAAAQVTREADLVAWWQMGEGATHDGSVWTVPDDSANSNDATSVADADPTIPGVPFANYPGVSTATQFGGGSDALVALDDPSLNFGETNFSVSMWIKANEGNLSNWQKLFAKADYGANTFLQCEVEPGADRLYFSMRDGDGDNDLAVNIGPWNGEVWRHFVFVRDTEVNNKIRMYDQGVLIGEKDDPDASIDNIGDLYIGSDSFGSGINAAIDDLRIYGAALSADDVAAIYNDGAGDFVIPEPSTLALLCMGTAAVLLSAWRRRKLA